VLDKKGEQEVLSEDELVELRDKTFELHYMAMINTSICWQQSWLLWLQEGDRNSKYFHSVMAGRRQGNTISSLILSMEVLWKVSIRFVRRFIIIF